MYSVLQHQQVNLREALLRKKERRSSKLKNLILYISHFMVTLLRLWSYCFIQEKNPVHTLEQSQILIFNLDLRNRITEAIQLLNWANLTL